MQKRSHTLLAQKLMKLDQGFGMKRYELAFLFGSFQPDVNPFSYLKGSLHYNKLKGHNYANSAGSLTSKSAVLRSGDV